MFQLLLLTAVLGAVVAIEDVTWDVIRNAIEDVIGVAIGIVAATKVGAEVLTEGGTMEIGTTEVLMEGGTMEITDGMVMETGR
jgi:hypothetical protein